LEAAELVDAPDVTVTTTAATMTTATRVVRTPTDRRR
jgi:hypothetical protein